jgi:hypothetical protein
VNINRFNVYDHCDRHGVVNGHRFGPGGPGRFHGGPTSEHRGGFREGRFPGAAGHGGEFHGSGNSPEHGFGGFGRRGGFGGFHGGGFAGGGHGGFGGGGSGGHGGGFGRGGFGGHGGGGGHR